MYVVQVLNTESAHTALELSSPSAHGMRGCQFEP